ncbi:hypothetical protein DPMN_001527 [Dreissena polymorpha]|uniref:Uncharacterized protein n=1 Tax=Dreissena polymorpha TaxID=45954 RepID=A0A9D4RQF3_DREPO|nr:hypothetical protein DPMN_001527 [Dreissena polymorpha]
MANANIRRTHRHSKTVACSGTSPVVRSTASVAGSWWPSRRPTATRKRFEPAAASLVLPSTPITTDASSGTEYRVVSHGTAMATRT